METYHKIGGIIIKNRKLLMVRKFDESHFILPGGRIEEKENAQECLARELKEELNIELKSMKFFKTFEAVHFKDKNKTITMDTYFTEIKGNPQASSEINEIRWVDSGYAKKNIKLALINRDFLVPELKKTSLID